MSLATVDRVVRVLREVVGIDANATVGTDMPLIDRGLSLDSVAVLELLVGLENEWGIELDPDALLEADALRTLGTLADYLDTLTKGNT